MAKYSRTEIVDAQQITFSDKEKETASQGLPVSAHGTTIRHESIDNIFSVLIHKLGRHAQEGEWVVTEASGKQIILSDEDFKKQYSEVPEAPAAPESPVKEPASEPTPETPAA